MLLMYSYKNQTEEITISLTPTNYSATNAAWCMVSYYKSRSTLLIQVQLALKDPQIIFCKAAFPPATSQIVLLHGLILYQMWNFSGFFIKIHAVCGSSFLYLVKVPLEISPALEASSKLILPSSLNLVWFWFEYHLELQVIAYRKTHQNIIDPREMSFITGHRWDFNPLTTILWAW